MIIFGINILEFFLGIFHKFFITPSIRDKMLPFGLNEKGRANEDPILPFDEQILDVVHYGESILLQIIIDKK